MFLAPQVAIAQKKSKQERPLNSYVALKQDFEKLAYWLLLIRKALPRAPKFCFF
jgi:hypothetical protein